MKFATALEHYKTQRSIAAALGIKEQAVGQWKKTGRVPKARAYQLQVLTKGRIKVDETVYADATATRDADAGTALPPGSGGLD